MTAEKELQNLIKNRYVNVKMLKEDDRMNMPTLKVIIELHNGAIFKDGIDHVVVVFSKDIHASPRHAAEQFIDCLLADNIDYVNCEILPVKSDQDELDFTQCGCNSSGKECTCKADHRERKDLANQGRQGTLQGGLDADQIRDDDY